MKKQEIISVLYELHKITGFRASLHDVNFEEIAAYPPEKLPICMKIHSIPGEYENCRKCDKEAFLKVEEKKETVIYRCRFGLTEAVSPLYNFGILTGYLMMGQISSDKTSKSDIVNALVRAGISAEDAKSSVNGVRVVPEELINSYVKIMTICAQYLTLSNAMPGAKPSVAESAKRYICENIDKKITIKDICDEIGCSKTTLIAAFKKEFGTTVNAAITKSKLEEAKKLLIAGVLSINEISQATGFYDQAYFSKVFSNEYGVPPSEYKKELSK
ncbi:MAG: helix-turn-helix domain-containing protein [Ruminococcaceae bacterium]|nr:helix-turn-helix domain-containing protein [Oscillospiraceae bacterium]